MDVAIIPFRVDAISHAVDPVKFYEYAASGTPVVSTRMPELDRVGPLCRQVDGVDGFVAGTWKAERKRKTAVLLIEPFGTVAKRTRAALGRHNNVAAVAGTQIHHKILRSHVGQPQHFLNHHIRRRHKRYIKLPLQRLCLDARQDQQRQPGRQYNIV